MVAAAPCDPAGPPARPRLILLRHAQGMLGTQDYDRLSETGLVQAALLGQRLAGEGIESWPVWSGALRRHRQTVDALPVAGVVQINPCLNEYRVDHLLMAAREQASHLGLRPPPESAFADPVAFLATFMAWFPEVLDYWQRDVLRDPINGSWAAFQTRVLLAVPAWRRCLRAGRSVVVVTSAGVISTLVAELCGHDLEWQRRLNVSLYNASVTELGLEHDRCWRIARLNCVEHLAERGLQTLA